MTQVLIAVDDSESSIKTARIAYALFGDGATYTVVNVADQSPMMWGGDSLVWGIGYPIVMAPSGAPAVAPGGSTPTTDAEAAAADHAPIDAAIQVARDVANEAHLPNPQVVGEVGHGGREVADTAVGADAWPSGDQVWSGQMPARMPNPM